MQTFPKSNSSKSNISQNQTLTRLRNQRLRKVTSLLGEPDIITVTRIKTSSSFFNKEKRTEQTSEYFINGIIFPTTAHFSTYISSKYQSSQNKSSSSVAIKAKLIMFDAFQQKDIQAEINIPGSLQVKVFNLSGQALKFEEQDYERAYYCSYLRSLKPMNYPNIVLSPYIYKVETHKQVLRKLIPFCFENSLRELHYQMRGDYTALIQDEYNANLALELIFNFLTTYNFWNLIDLTIAEIEKVSQLIQIKDVQYLKYKMMFLKKQYPKILQKSSQVLIHSPAANEWKELQIECLFRLKNFKLVKVLGDNILRHGGTHPRIYSLIAISYLETKDFKNFFKILNSVLTLYNDEEIFVQQVSHSTKRLYFMQLSFTKGQNISSYPELCFEFDNQFLNRQSKLSHHLNLCNSQTNSLIKQDSIEQIIRLIKKIDSSLQFKELCHSTTSNHAIKNTGIFYSLLVKFQKIKGWAELMKYRGECFWLETDFKNEDDFKEHSSLFNSSNSLIQGSTNKKSTNQISFSQIRELSQKNSPFKSISESFEINHQEGERSPKIDHCIDYNVQQAEVEFGEGELSEQEEEQEISDLPACSKRVSSNANTARRNFFNLKKTTSEDDMKILCSLPLEKLFISFYEDLKLQIELQKWTSKINFSKINELSAERKEILAILFLKKAFLHLKLQRYRKCEQSLKQARRISQSALILIISSYQLIHLYMKNNAMKGVQFYIVDLIKLFNLYGIKKFDIVPEWAKQIITYIIEMQGMSILGKLGGPFKELLVRWLRNNHSENSLLKKDSANKSQAVYQPSG